MEQVNDSADAEISSASEPVSENQSYEALPGTEEDTFQKPHESPIVDDVNEFTDQESISTGVGGIEMKEKMDSIPETLDETRDVVELTKEVRRHS